MTFFSFRLWWLEWDKVRRTRSFWWVVGMLWLFGLLPIVMSYNRQATPIIGLPAGLAQSVTSGILFTGVLLGGVMGAMLSDLDAEGNTRLLLFTSGYSRLSILAVKLAFGAFLTIGVLGGQLILDATVAEANALFAFHRTMPITWPSWSLMVSITCLVLGFLWIGFAGRITSHSLLIGAGIPVAILFGERYLAPDHVFLAWLPNFALSNALFTFPLRWPSLGTWIPLLIWIIVALTLTTRTWLADVDA